MDATATTAGSTRFLGFFSVMFIIMALTGHCGVCGMDRDYVGESIDTMGECK